MNKIAISNIPSICHRDPACTCQFKFKSPFREMTNPDEDFCSEASLIAAIRKNRCDKRRFSLQVSRMRQSAERFLTRLLNTNYSEAADGTFEVIIYCEVEQCMESLKLFHNEFDIFFHPHRNQYQELSQQLQRLPGVIDVQEAQTNKAFLEAANRNSWPLSYALINDVLDVFESPPVP